MKRRLLGLCVAILSLYLVGVGCKKEESSPFGMEDGYFYWLEDEKKVWIKRDRDHLSIRFYEGYGKAFHDSVLAEYGIETVWAQSFGKHPSYPGYYRVTKKPAEHFYTSYGGDTISNRLGNLPEVEYVLPVFWTEQFWDRRLTPTISYIFHDHIPGERREEILDSLEAADRVKRHKEVDDPWWPETLYVTKASPADPYTLSHRYYETDFFKSASMRWWLTTRWLED